MGEFPENDVEIFVEYLTPGVAADVARLDRGLQAVKLNFPAVLDLLAVDEAVTAFQVDAQKQALAVEVHQARVALLAALPVAEAEVKDLRTTYELARVRNFPSLAALASQESKAPANVSRQTLLAALHPQTIELVQARQQQVEVRDQGGNLEGFVMETVPETWTLKAFPEAADSFDLDALVKLLDFMSPSAERAYRFGLLRAEKLKGQGEHEGGLEAAMVEYGRLLTIVPGERVADRNFISLERAAACAAHGDNKYRARRMLSVAQRAEVMAIYDKAVGLLDADGASIGQRNPRRLQVARHAALQKRKLESSLTYFGYPENYVPVLRDATLLELASGRLAAAEAAATKFEQFQRTADFIHDQLAQLDFEMDIKQVQSQIAGKRVADAAEGVKTAGLRVDLIQQQIDSLSTGLAVNIGGMVLQGVASAFLAGGVGGGGGGGGVSGTSLPGVAGAVGGIGNAMFDYFNRKASLKIQKDIAILEKRHAEREEEIAGLEKDIIATTLEFMESRIEAIQNRDLNPGVYYAAAGAYRTLAEVHLDAAMQWAFLFERAVAFLRLDPSVTGLIGSDYLNKFGVLAAAGELGLDLQKVIARNVPLTRFQFLTEDYSVKTMFPIEFKMLQLEGSMSFTIPLPTLDRLRPGVHRMRIKRVGIKLPGGVTPPSGFGGRIIHQGTFLVRDEATTPEPGHGRLIPTDEALAEAFAALEAGGVQGTPIAGVIPFCAAEGRFEISAVEHEFDLNDASPGALFPIEGYGPAGSWRLELERIDMRLVSDLLLRVTYVIPESDGGLARRVKGLLADYERELLAGDAIDLITPVSLREDFPRLLNDLRSGQTTLSLARDRFPTGIIDLKLKTVIALAIDSQKKGLAGLRLEISRGDAVHLFRTTRADGFSENLAEEIPVIKPRATRPPVEGDYTLRLPEPSQSSELSDLVLFFMYEFTRP